MPSPHEPSAPRRPAHIAEFEGLRGLLAAWVVFGHILLFSGYSYQDGWFGIVFSPVLGVYAFMMLSGFVIAGALDQRQEGWSRFMARRFFRLYPAYAFCLVLAVLSLNLSAFVSGSPQLSVFGPENLERLADVKHQMAAYLVFDATLLQALVPKWLFANAQESFLPPTWSLTLEWLFYILIPFWIWQLRRRAGIALASLGIFVVLVALLETQLKAINPSFHPGNVFHFMTGTGSYYLWKHLPDLSRREHPDARTGFWMAALLGLLLPGLPYRIWTLMMVIVLYRRFHPRPLYPVECAGKLLAHPWLQFLGKISYSTYLVHWTVIEVCLFWVIRWAPAIEDRLPLALVCCVLVFPLTWLASSAIHRCIELPGIELGKRLLSGRRPLRADEDPLVVPVRAQESLQVAGMAPVSRRADPRFRT